MGKNDGWGVFPQVQSTGFGINIKGGLSLRDWFAGMAPIPRDEIERLMKHNGESYESACARFSYSYADAMLAAREEPDNA